MLTLRKTCYSRLPAPLLTLTPAYYSTTTTDHHCAQQEVRNAMPFIPSPLARSRQVYHVFGANTNVGKTVVSTALCGALRWRIPQNEDVLYLKPVQTGPERDGDVRHVKRYVPGITTKCLHRFDEPLSPHLAARDSHKLPTDAEICTGITTSLQTWARKSGRGTALVETAGGVLSPGPNGSLQADLYRPLRLPAILVVDSRLGGISATISAFESLTLRGQDVEAVVVFGDEYFRNHEFLGRFAASRDVPALVIPAPPTTPTPVGADASTTRGSAAAAANEEQDRQAMAAYYAAVSKRPEVVQLLDILETRHHQRIERLESMADGAHEVVWYPFTQHQGMTAADITVIDSAHDDCFQTLVKPKPTATAEASTSASGLASGRASASATTSNEDTQLLQPTFDGSASWWTQCLGHGNPELARTAAYAAGRYGHVMFPGTIHEPALSLCERLLKLTGNPRLEKVFFADNGSVGMEVAVKMGLRAASKRYGWSSPADDTKTNGGGNGENCGAEIGVLGLRGSYHGDTLGVMECSEPSTFNKKVEWYRGRGYWLDFPKVKMKRGSWWISVPESMREEGLGEGSEFASLSSIFDLHGRRESELAQRYKEYIKTRLDDLVVRQGRKFGALIIEPIVLGAGGMLFSDPLFQQLLVQTVRQSPQLLGPPDSPVPSTPTSWSGLPVIFDEVFSGLGRLGRATASSFLDVHPDIVVNSKLLTGGLMPLSTTMASGEIFAAFNSPEKSDALLHGHSYTANPVGCSVAEYAVHKIEEMTSETNRGHSGQWTEFVRDWDEGEQRHEAGPNVWSLWSHDLVRELSFAESVEGVWALGTVLSIELRDDTGHGGYTSSVAAGLQKHLRTGDVAGGFNVHARVLGNVLYVMGSLTSTRESLRKTEVLLRQYLL